VKRKALLQAINEVRYSCMRGVPYSLSFKPCGNLTAKQRESLEAALKHSFEDWRDTWVIPTLDAISREIQNGKR
jgi:hypothetical protein